MNSVKHKCRIIFGFRLERLAVRCCVIVVCGGTGLRKSIIGKAVATVLNISRIIRKLYKQA